MVKARASWDAGDTKAAAGYFELAAINEDSLIDRSGDSTREESFIAQGHYAQAVAIARQRTSNSGPDLWLLIANCELGKIEAATAELSPLIDGPRAQYRAQLATLPISQAMTLKTLEATAWLLTFNQNGPWHSPQGQLNWLNRADKLAPRNAMIEFRKAKILLWNFKQPAVALPLLEDAQRQFKTMKADLDSDGLMNDVEQQLRESRGRMAKMTRYGAVWFNPDSPFQ